jgi:DNA methylase
MRHRFHSICPYFAMFPELFVQKHLIWAKKNAIVFDPFSGRGTTVFESLLNDRFAYGCDINPVAICLSNAKANPPPVEKLKKRLEALKKNYKPGEDSGVQSDEFFKLCFHKRTLQQILYLQKKLKWKTTSEDCFLAALVLGSLHGEGGKDTNYFSNQMPRTISTKPNYSVKWWKSKGLKPDEKDVFQILSKMIDFRFASLPPKKKGKIVAGDARRSSQLFPSLINKVDLVITSPPYLNVTSYEEDQWLRLWFLGGKPYPQRSPSSDDRHQSKEKYWQFLQEVWQGVSPLVKKNARIIVRIGGKGLDKKDLREGLLLSLRNGTQRKITLIEEKTSEIKGSQRRSFQPGNKNVSKEHDFHFVIS